MSAPLTSNTQAILLLTAPLTAGRSAEVLSLSEYNRLARILREKKKQPADLLGSDAGALVDACAEPFGRGRLEALLARGFLLSQAVDGWSTRAIWVISRADYSYPKRLKIRLKEDAPPMLYGCGDVTLLEKGGLAVVGSREVGDELIRYTDNLGKLCAAARRSVVSGGAKGVDRAAMEGALKAGGNAVGVLADNLEKVVLDRAYRAGLMSGRLTLVSPYEPASAFLAGQAIQRNKLIYALADVALVVTSDFERGGTWAGAIEQLERARFVPLFVRGSDHPGKGNAALRQQGAILWPEPRTAGELEAALVSALKAASNEPRQQKLFSPKIEE